MDQGLHFLLFILLGMGALFAGVIAFGLRFRKQHFETSLDLRAASLWPLVSQYSASRADCLYALIQDFSSASAGLIVRSVDDKEIARITYCMGFSPCMTIATSEGNYAADVIPTWSSTLRLYDESKAGETLCVRTQGIWKRKASYEGGSIGKLDIDLRAVIKRTLPVAQEGRIFGVGVRPADRVLDRVGLVTAAQRAQLLLA
jgi:hypothetical protein